MINYILLPVFVLMVLTWKLAKRTKLAKVSEMDIWTGRRYIEEPVEEADKPQPSGISKKLRDIVIG